MLYAYSAFGEWYILLYSYTPLQVFLCAGEGCTDSDGNILHYYHIGLAFLTGFLFATHLPERLAPGSFDYIGAQKRLHVSAVHWLFYYSSVLLIPTFFGPILFFLF